MTHWQGKMKNLFQRWVDRLSGNGLMQEESEASGERFVTPRIAELIRQAGAEGCVLLKNDGVLPLHKEKEVTVFGRCQLDWFYVGYGSGGDVHAPYLINLMEGLSNVGLHYNRKMAQVYRSWVQQDENRAYHGWWGHWPYSHPEMSVDEQLIRENVADPETALVVIGRASGEDRENKLKPGSYYLTEEEEKMLDTVTAVFEKTVVILNIGSIMDMAWTKKYGDKISAILVAWLGGMESGNAVADVLCGNISPCGKLADTIACSYEDYPSSRNFGGRDSNDYSEGIFVGYRYFDEHPEKVLWPFGFGLSYTSFELMSLQCEKEKAVVRVTNTGVTSGKEVVALFCRPAKGKIKKTERVLAAFAKSDLLQPGESQILTLPLQLELIASFDESSHAFVLEAGKYQLEANEIVLGSFAILENTVLQQCEEICVPSKTLRERILARLPVEIPVTGDQGYRLKDVVLGKITLDHFIAQLSDEELEALSRGHGTMNSRLGAPGNAGVLGGILPSLRKKGIQPITCCDGPAGLRLKQYCSLQPCGTALACTWNTELVEALSRKIGEEMIRCQVDVILAPGMNIHRNPLCGRNFEYFSEDPVLSGKMGAATVRGIQSTGRAACPKHFACNNQETRRNFHNSVVSERALREIYLRNFEICVKEAVPKTLMTSYNKVNGVWSHYHYDLVTTVLRKEWGYEGMVMTDWWMRRAISPEFPGIRNNAYRVRAQVDVLMPGNMDQTARNYKRDDTMKGITRGELQRTAKNVLQLLILQKEWDWREYRKRHREAAKKKKTDE